MCLEQKKKYKSLTSKSIKRNFSHTLISLFILFVLISLPVEANEKIQHVHDHMLNNKNWITWIGNFHPVILHFPIALIIMTGIAELLAIKSHSPIFHNAARFMIFFAAITVIPTALLGLAYGYKATYEGTLSFIFWWHRFSGLATAVMAIITVFLKELHLRKKLGGRYYGISLGILVVLVTVTGYLGGDMTFGLSNLFP